MFPCPVTMVVKLCVVVIFIFSLSATIRKKSFVIVTLVDRFQSLCHFSTLVSSSSRFTTLFGTRLQHSAMSRFVAASFARVSASSFPRIPQSQTVCEAMLYTSFNHQKRWVTSLQPSFDIEIFLNYIFQQLEIIQSISHCADHTKYAAIPCIATTWQGIHPATSHQVPCKSKGQHRFSLLVFIGCSSGCNGGLGWTYSLL